MTNRSQKKGDPVVKSPRGEKIDANLESTLLSAMLTLTDDIPITYAEMKPINRFGPFGQSQLIIIDENSTYMAILGENSKQIVYYIFNWEY